MVSVCVITWVVAGSALHHKISHSNGSADQLSWNQPSQTSLCTHCLNHTLPVQQCSETKSVTAMPHIKPTNRHTLSHRHYNDCSHSYYLCTLHWHL